MTYRFIRTGGRKPVNEGYHPGWQIKLCFETCAPEVRQQVEKFLSDLSQQTITFDFGDSQVEVIREK